MSSNYQGTLQLFCNVLILRTNLPMSQASWLLLKSFFTWPLCLEYRNYFVKWRHNNVANKVKKLPSLAWSYRDTSSNGWRSLRMFALRSVALTWGAKVSTTLFPKRCVNWTIEPRKQDLKILFQTLTDITLHEILVEVTNHTFKNFLSYPV